MNNVILFEISQQQEYSLENLVQAIGEYDFDQTQGFLIQEYDVEFLKATYWKRKIKKAYRYNLEKQEFETVEEEIINIADFGINIKDRKLIIFSNKLMAQQIITLIGLISNNAYSISEHIVDIYKLVNYICTTKGIELLKMQLVDICIEKGVLVNCNINLSNQDDPRELALKYIKNISRIAFRLDGIMANISIYKSGKISLSKISSDEMDEIIDAIIEILG